MDDVGFDSPFLRGTYAPVCEERDCAGLAVSGELPRALDGAFLRNGPNPQFPPLDPYRWFGGDGMVHGIWLEEGAAVRYRNRWVETFGLQLERREGRCLFPTLSPPADPVPEAQARGEMIKNSANTHIVAHGGRLLALCETGEPYALDDNLDTVGPWQFDGALTGPMTAHPKIDPATGVMHTFGYSPFPPYLRYYQVAPDGVLTTTAEVAVPRPVMMHDFAITDRAAVFLDAPLVFDLERAMGGDNPFDWQPDHGMRIGLVSFDSPDRVRWFEVPEPGYAFHTYNAWREDGRTVLVCGRKERVVFDGLPPKEPEHLWRYTVDEGSGSVQSERLSDVHSVLPRIDDRRTGSATRYGYAACILGHEAMLDWDGLVRFDLESGAHVTWQWPAGAVCGEPVFAPDPCRDGELDGWVLQLVQDPRRGATDLCVLDAAAIEAGPVATVHLPCTVPNGFHGSWVPREQLSRHA